MGLTPMGRSDRAELPRRCALYSSQFEPGLYCVILVTPPVRLLDMHSLGAGIPGLGESREIGLFRLFLISFVGTARTGGCYTISFSACMVLGGDCVGSCRLEGF